MADDTRLAAPAARLPKGAASQIATTVHNALCGCMGSNTGITLRSRDWDLVRDAVASLLESWQGASPAAPADDEAAKVMRTLHVTATRDIPDGHTDQRVRYEYDGESWEGWLISVGRGDFGAEAYVMRDNGERWVVKPYNLTAIDGTALAALREGQ